MTSEQNNKVNSPRQKSRKKGLTIFALVLVALAVVCSAWYWMFKAGKQETEDAYVQGHILQVSPQISGTVTHVYTDDGAFVKKGQTLLELDANDANIALEQAKANLGQTVRQVRTLFNNVIQAKAVVAQKEIALNKAKTDYSRRKDMVSAGGLSQEELSHANDMVEAAQKDLTVSEQQLKAQQAKIYNTTVETHPLVQEAIAKLNQAYLNQVRTKIVAPMDGFVAKKSVELGQKVAPGSPLMAVIPLNSVWVDANFKETQLTDMRLGQKVTLVSDIYGDNVTYHGRVESLGIGTGSAFSLLPAQNATGNWIKVVQRLPVKITIEPDELEKHPLRIGLSMTVTVETDSQSGDVLPKASESESPLVTTNVYEDQLSGADQLVSEILKANDIGQE
ncbi:efflux RND transporter periplasmic adaptor subunit [Vibrio sp.]|uniref:HlyD family efflux transporter periplasmic adaptor subunit n=1 Tax=Vibrio viridaestus TaxID=2487322 RepID=A0A3N9TIE4_9VIBR|nr:efflux RND transporter periplasmic adaptor subunit [Vibrio viridaestus]MDC0610698.1 efflux RND transporter periplasmic adaptor subunit [Vibrio sp.]RQW63673.1 HlyD family efflux transporter periplasmic adaptor subunit [Vibrio viridaestus]